MLAARFAGKRLVETVDLPDAEPGPDEVLVRVLCCGVCGSDLHAYNGLWGQDYKPGHEFCGVVEAAGARVEGLRIGARVAGECFAHCGQCEACRRGHYNQCESITWSPGRPAGAMAQRMVYPAASLFPLPDALTDEQAAMVEPTAVAFRAVARGQVGQGTSVAVIGAGAIGLLCAAVASARGAAPVFLVAKYPHQARKAVELGVSEPLLTTDGNPKDAILDRTAGRGVDVAIDAVAIGTSLSTALAIAARHGTVVEVGGITRPMMVALNPLLGKELHVTGSTCYAFTEGRRDFEWAIELISQGQVDSQALITHRLPLADVTEAFRIAADKGTGAIKVLVTM